MEPDYLTEDYFNMFRFAYEYAADKGMELWLYDEGAGQAEVPADVL